MSKKSDNKTILEVKVVPKNRLLSCLSDLCAFKAFTNYNNTLFYKDDDECYQEVTPEIMNLLFLSQFKKLPPIGYAEKLISIALTLCGRKISLIDYVHPVITQFENDCCFAEDTFPHGFRTFKINAEYSECSDKPAYFIEIINNLCGGKEVVELLLTALSCLLIPWIPEDKILVLYIPNRNAANLLCQLLISMHYPDTVSTFTAEDLSSPKLTEVLCKRQLNIDTRTNLTAFKSGLIQMLGRYLDGHPITTKSTSNALFVCKCKFLFVTHEIKSIKDSKDFCDMAVLIPLTGKELDLAIDRARLLSEKNKIATYLYDRAATLYQKKATFPTCKASDALKLKLIGDYAPEILAFMDKYYEEKVNHSVYTKELYEHFLEVTGVDRSDVSHNSFSRVLSEKFEIGKFRNGKSQNPQQGIKGIAPKAAEPDISDCSTDI